ncbi:Uncharacterized protein YrrD, contains PRC-barrel domain [Natronincola peptidivorans]|uniref:Uncharacterized protein YrrD, contains PRC-barrel domain n=1 Tax=Natronincola peptidivorans TaxID=426128 RepID=A0A1H9YSS3_9FIRM|nr:PRC-barrel domain-containing protein [Natronincola peptidivorans]SES72177.1 Uncharacterized protein YrrD, contains PRC-barrel domain [Natronincola peptidivorans]
MIKRSELIGLGISNEKSILQNHYIKDIIYGKKKLKVLGLIVGVYGFSNKHHKVIPYHKIRNISDEGIKILSEKDMITPHQIPEIEEALQRPVKVIDFSIYDYENNLIGIIKDTIIEIKSGKVLALVISEGVLDDIIKGYSVLPIDYSSQFHEDHLRVNKEMIKSISPQGGGLQKLLGIDKLN